MTLLSEIHENARWLSDVKGSNVIVIPNFLPEEQRDQLFSALQKAQKAFYYRVAAGRRMTANICFSPEDDDCLSREYPVNAADGERARCGAQISEACSFYESKIISKMSEISKALNISTSPLEKLPLTIVNGRNGNVAFPHKDESSNRFKISLLYYMHKQPKRFSGGDLEFYATSKSQPGGYDPNPIDRIEHQDNLLVVFPSDTYHGTTPVISDSIHFEDGRFVFTSFL